MRVVDQVGDAFTLGLRITAPFVIYAIIVNLAAGFVNKLTPTIPVYFIATPFVMFGGLLMLYYLGGEILMQYLQTYAAWLKQG